FNNQIVFDALDQHGTSQLYLLSVVSKSYNQLTFSNDSKYMPAFSHDGSHILFHSGNQLKILTLQNMQTVSIPNSESATKACWSQDDEAICFALTHENNDADLYLMNIDGTNKRKITTYQGRNEWPKWSPDNNYIIYNRYNNNQCDLWLYDVRKNLHRPVVEDSDNEWCADWSDNGKYIVYSRTSEEQSSLNVLSVTESNK
nr:hypothetical protein [Candidatus Cloacimonadota bacterium]